MSSLTRHGRLKFNTADIDGNCSDNIGVYLRDGYGLQLTSTNLDAYTQALDVNIQGPVNEDGYVMVSLQDSDIEVDVDIAQYAEDTPHTTGDLGDFMLSIKLSDIDGANDAYLADLNGDYQGLFTNDKGELYTKDEDAYAKLCDILTGLESIDFEDAITNEDGYLFVDFSHDLLNADGYLQVNLPDIDIFTCPDGTRAMEVHIACPLNEDGYQIVEIAGGDLTVNTNNEVEIADCPLVDGYSGMQSLISDGHRRLWVNNSSAIAGKVSTVSVTDTAALLLSGGALAGRTRILMQNKGEEIVYIGFDSGVLADDSSVGGFELDCGDAISLELSDCIDIWAITPTSTGATVKVIETA